MNVSIIIPVYNQEKLLPRAIESIPLEKVLEVIIIDDGSTDGTCRVALELANNSKIKVFHSDVNKGVANARNIGLDNAQGDYIFMLDSDDYLYTEAFIKALNYLNGEDLVYYKIQDNKGDLWYGGPIGGAPGQVKFMKRAFIGNLRYNESLKIEEDLQFQKDMEKKNPVEVFTDLIVVHYNYPRSGSLSDQLERIRRKRRKRR